MICLKVEILEKKGSKLTFLIEETDMAFANSLRRVMISEIPTMAIEWIDVYENNSALFDEVISHRLGMMPLRFDPKKYNRTEDCKCSGKGCPLCQVVLVIDKKGPGLVIAGDMKSSDRAVKAADPGMIVVQLLEGESLKLEAIAKLGTGTEHAKHHAANASFQYYPLINFHGTKADMNRAVKSCPKGVLGIKREKLVLTDPAKCDICRSCMESVKGVELKWDDSRIIFRVESVSGLEPEYIVDNAAEILREKAQEFKKNLDKI